MNNESTNNRRTQRQNIHVPITLEHNDTDITHRFLSYTSDINLHGLRVFLPENLPQTIDSKFTIGFDVPNFPPSFKVPVKLIWSSQMEGGLEFTENCSLIQEILTRTSLQLETSSSKLKKFYPYVGDEDIDTHNYEYFPITDKLITDTKTVREYIFQLKRGINSVNADEYIYGQYAVGDNTLNQVAIDIAHSAFQKFQKFSLERRRKIFDDARELLIKEKEQIIELMVVEGHPRKLAEWEYSGMLSTITKESLDYFQSQIIQTLNFSPDETVIHLRRPYGVVCISTPRNASSIGFMAALALLVGNTLVIKPPVQMPLCSIYIWKNIYGKALKMNGAPRGTINIVYGNSRKFMDEWINNSKVKCIFFFGDSEKGIEIGKKIYEKGKKPILELSGNDYLVAWKDAPLNEATDSLLDSFMGSTQICMVPKKAIVHEEIYDHFIMNFIGKVKNLQFGLPSNPDTILSPVSKINEFFEFLNQALENGAELLHGGYRVNHRGEKDIEGQYIAPTVIYVPLERANTMKCITHENFFPLLPIIKATGGGLTNKEKDEYIYENIIDTLNKNEYGLRISIWLTNDTFIKRFINDVHQCGLLRINSRHIGFSHSLSVNGGTGKSGGPLGEMNHVWQKTSHIQGISVTKSLSMNETPNQQSNNIRIIK